MGFSASFLPTPMARASMCLVFSLVLVGVVVSASPVNEDHAPQDAAHPRGPNELFHWRWRKAYNRYISLTPFDEALTRTFTYYTYIPSASCNDTQRRAFNCTICSRLKKDNGVELLGFVHDYSHQSVVMLFLDKSLKALVVVYRPTYTYLNWLEDANYPKIPIRDRHGKSIEAPGLNIMVHKGFYNSIMHKLQPRLIGMIARAQRKYSGYKLYVTGLSLGGAQASLGALDLILHGFHVDRLVTFGSPRVGNRDFALFFMEKATATCYRVTDTNDIVPFLPGQKFGMRTGGYLHLPHEVYLMTVDKEKKEYKFVQTCQDEYNEDSTSCHNSLPMRKGSFVDHVQYILRVPGTVFPDWYPGWDGSCPMPKRY
eukprot:Nk52_evm7s365 gene=Nk52_evmTU7s365